MARNYLLALVIGCALGCPLAGSKAGDDKPISSCEEINWARGVAEDMFASAINGDTEQVEALATMRLRSIYNENGKEPEFGKKLVNTLQRNTFNSVTWSGAVAWTGSQIVPEKNEIRFKGILHGEDTETKPADPAVAGSVAQEIKINCKVDCTVRVVRDKGMNQWKIDYIHFEDPAEIPAAMPMAK